MGKQVTVRFCSPFAKSTITAPDAVPIWVVQGLIRGFLSEFGASNNLKQKWIERCERRMMALAKDLGRQSVPQHPDVIDGIRRLVFDFLAEKSQHSYYALNADSDLILQALKRLVDNDCSYETTYLQLPYAEVGRSEHRRQWLQEELPGLLTLLHQRTLCLHEQCVCRSAPPVLHLAQLSEWAEISDPGRIRDRILGLFHSIAPATVRRSLSRSPRYSA